MEFTGVMPARFLARHKTFLAECELGGSMVIAHLPNPGRMLELLFPGCCVYLQHAPAPHKKTAYRVVAVDKAGEPVMLDTLAGNRVAANLLAAQRVPGWEDWQVVRSEVKVGDSRFDFLLTDGKQNRLLEVKSCTLFGRGVAMFPDAVTERGRKHLLELASLAAGGQDVGVLFIVHHPATRWFLPDYHTDFAFAQAFAAVQTAVQIKVMAVGWQYEQGRLRLLPTAQEAIVPRRLLAAELQDGGVYLVLLQLPAATVLTIGKEVREFPAGYYGYVGSARHNLSQRLARHARKRKRFHWHIDYLRAAAVYCAGFAIRTPAALEHDLAAAVAAIAEWQVPHFGSSDCRCFSHLFGWRNNPLETPPLSRVLQTFRMDRLEEALTIRQEEE